METIKLDLIPSGKMPSLHASQYDDGREHGIDLFENGVVYKLDGTETLTINERKGDDCICSLDIENTFADSNHIVFASTEQMCAVWGNNICELVIAKGKKTIGTLNFILEIEQSPTEGGIESESEIKNLERQIEAITEEVIGDDYYTAEETDEAIATAIEGKADKTYVDTELDKKADKNNTYTKTEVDTLIDNLPEPMIFKGTLGVGGTIQTLPTASASNEGWTYKVITDGTYAGQEAKVGDVFTSNGSDWVLIPSGDDDNDTWRAIKVNGVEVLGNGISSGAVDFVGSENIEVEFDGNGNKVGVKTKNIYTKEEVDDIIYNILPDDTASGSIANFETDLALPIKSLEIDVNAKQDLHGYDYPWAAGGGKNMLNMTAENGQAGQKYRATGVEGNITLESIGTYGRVGFVVEGLTIGETYNFSADIAHSVASGENCTIYFTDAIAWTNQYGQLSIGKTTSESTPFRKTIVATSTTLFIGFYITAANTYGDVIVVKNAQVEKGSSATSWTPYENICPISGFSALNVTRTGINAWDEQWELGAFAFANGTFVPATNRIRNKNPIKVKPNTQYFAVAPTRFAVGYYDKDGNYLGYQDNKENSIITTKPNTDHIYFFCTVTSYGNNISVNADTTDTTYHAYNGTTEVINLGGTYYGGHFTQDKAGHRQFVVTHNYFDIGSATWNPAADGYTQSKVDITDMKTAPSGNTKANFVCSSYKTDAPTNVYNKVENSTIAIATNQRLRVYDTRLTGMTGQQVQDALTGVYIAYEMVTPIIIDLPDGEPIATLIGTNNIFADTGDTEVVFKCSVNDYVSAHSGGNLLGMGGVYLGGAKSGGSEEEPTEESEEPKEVTKTLGDEPISKK